MKKLISIILLLGIAGLFNSAYSQNTDVATAQASANVLLDVSVTQVSNLVFGDVFQGTSSSVTSSSAGAASFDVEADSSKTVELDFTLPNEGGTSSNSYTYWLVGPGGAELEITFGTQDANWETGTTHGGGNLFDPKGVTTAAMPADNTIRVWIGGTVNPTSTQSQGTYTGDIVLRATYN